VVLNGMTTTVTPDKTGLTYSGGNQREFFQKARLTPNFTISLKGEVTHPAITTEAADKVAQTIDKQLKTQFTVSVENQVQTVKPDVIASWISVGENETKDQLVINYDRARIKDYLQPFADKVYVAGVAKKVTTLDGQVVSQIEGSPGRAMKLEASVDAIIKALTDSQGSAKTIVQAVTPAAQVTASYTRTSRGLQALVNDWVKSHKGSYNIALRSTAGDISASYNAGGKIYPASIYKLFVADVAYTKAANGQLDLNASTSTGRSINACMELMIVRSDNDCAYAVGDAIGWDANNGFLASQGFGSTTLKKHVWTTNANDILNLLLKLQGGSLINPQYSSTLLSYMSRQIYRSGIPAGSAGSVADKVGFVDNYNHDAAIVYHPGGTYALVIMTTNSSFSNIADLARQISNVMKQ
jgi:beta-lactamase class A